MATKIAFAASSAPVAQTARAALIGCYGDVPPQEAEVIVALGGDGFMLQTLHGSQDIPAPVYGMNRGTIGFLMNEYQEGGLVERLEQAEEAVINPLSMAATCVDGSQHDALAINEVSLLRAGPQAAKLRITVDGRLRMEELVCDGALVATPAGSTAYNYSTHGPILPIGADVLALTAMAACASRSAHALIGEGSPPREQRFSPRRCGRRGPGRCGWSRRGSVADPRSISGRATGAGAGRACSARWAHAVQ